MNTTTHNSFIPVRRLQGTGSMEPGFVSRRAWSKDFS